MSYQYFAAALVGAAVMSPAFAQDADTTAPTAATSSFTGPRAEIFGGYLNTQARYRSGVGAPIGSQNRRSNGGEAGGEIGYDIPLGDSFVAGPFGSFALTAGDKCLANGSYTSACLRPQMEWSAGARAGVKLMDGRVLGYVKGAYVDTGIETSLNSGGTVYDSHLWRHGYRAGVGAEYALSPHAYLKAEYDFTRTRRFGLDSQGFANTSLRYDRNAALAGFGIRF